MGAGPWRELTSSSAGVARPLLLASQRQRHLPVSAPCVPSESMMETAATSNGAEPANQKQLAWKETRETAQANPSHPIRLLSRRLCRLVSVAGWLARSRAGRRRRLWWWEHQEPSSSSEAGRAALTPCPPPFSRLPAPQGSLVRRHATRGRRALN
jgi:hypothetical protein